VEVDGVELRWHGLRARAACDRKLAGAENRAFASLRMSITTVEQYINPSTTSFWLARCEISLRLRESIDIWTAPRTVVQKLFPHRNSDFS